VCFEILMWIYFVKSIMNSGLENKKVAVAKQYTEKYWTNSISKM